jgi:hypothetical protein
MKRRVTVVLALTWMLAGCAGAATTPATAPTPTATAAVPRSAVPSASLVASPAASIAGSYLTLTKSGLANVVAAPDRYAGNGFKLWACVAKVDSAGGQTTLHAKASHREQSAWEQNGTSMVFIGPAALLAGTVKGDVVAIDAVGLGPQPSTGLASGSPALALFQVDGITRSGTCS